MARPSRPKVGSNRAVSGFARPMESSPRTDSKLMALPADQRCGVWPSKPTSAASIDNAAAISAAEATVPVSAGNCGMTKVAWPLLAPVAPTRQATRPIFSSSTMSAARPPSMRLSSTAVPTVGCPAKGSSAPGVKMRSLARCFFSSAGSTNTVSGWLNSRAMLCIASPDSPSASSTTASGLPEKRFSVNTSRVTKRRRMTVLGFRLASMRRNASERQGNPLIEAIDGSDARTRGSTRSASSPRRRGPSNHCGIGVYWMPAFAGMTAERLCSTSGALPPRAERVQLVVAEMRDRHGPGRWRLLGRDRGQLRLGIRVLERPCETLLIAPDPGAMLEPRVDLAGFVIGKVDRRNETRTALDEADIALRREFPVEIELAGLAGMNVDLPEPIDVEHRFRVEDGELAIPAIGDRA